MGYLFLGLVMTGCCAAIFLQLWRTRNPLLRGVALRVRRLRMLLDVLGLTPRLKILIVFFQCIQAMPKVYSITFPSYYSDFQGVVDVLTFDWARYVVPTGCLSWGYFGRLLLQGIVPLVGMLFILLCGWVLSQVLEWRRQSKERANFHEQARIQRAGRRRFSADGRRYSAGGKTVAHKWYEGLYTTLPLVLLAAFTLCPGVSANIFSAWSCVNYIDDSGPPSTSQVLMT